jgi:hypothetical protein
MIKDRGSTVQATWRVHCLSMFRSLDRLCYPPEPDFVVRIPAITRLGRATVVQAKIVVNEGF